MPEQKHPYFPLLHMIALIDEPNASRCRRLIKENEKRIITAPGSSHNHQAWIGGYHDHIVEVMNKAIVLYMTLNALRPLPFSLSSLLLVLFLHDGEKPWKYKTADGGLVLTTEDLLTMRIREEFREKSAQRIFREDLIRKYGIELTEEERIALLYVEGEYDHSTKERRMNPLGALSHICDVASARLWPEHPLEENDPWSGAMRPSPTASQALASLRQDSEPA